MTVLQLISILEECDPNANVFIMTQQNYPLEHDLFGVTAREGFSDQEGDGAKGSDVLLVEGGHLRYGSRDAWNTAVRGGG
jgi:hypothetical protein